MPTSRRWRAARPSAALLLAAVAAPAGAVAPLVPYASAQIERNSNLFSLSGRDEALLLNGDPQLDDRVLRYVAGLELSLPLSGQTLRAVAEGRRIEFDHFDRLNHDEHLFSVGLDWRLHRALDGSIDYRQERRMAAFAERETTALSLEDERIGSAQIKLGFAASWRVETELRTRELESPLPGFPAFRLQEDTVRLALKYLDMEPLAAGLFVEHLDGAFEGVPGATGFTQDSVGVTADYAVNGLTRLGSQLGYTRREDDRGNGVSGTTGLFTLHRDLSAKTAVDLQAFRRLRSDVRGAGTVEEIGAGGGFAWQATYRIALTGSYLWTRGSYDAGGAGNAGRDDDRQLATLGLKYQMLDWLSLRPYTGYESRESSFAPDDFEATIVGAELKIRFE